MFAFMDFCSEDADNNLKEEWNIAVNDPKAMIY